MSPEQAIAYRQILCLLVAQRRPAYYLGDGHVTLQTLANSYLRVMAAKDVTNGILIHELGDDDHGTRAACHALL